MVAPRCLGLSSNLSLRSDVLGDFPREGDGYMLTIAQMVGKDGKKYVAVLEAIEFATREISYYTIFEGTYLYQSTETTEQLSKIKHDLSERLIEVYSKILELLLQVKKYLAIVH